MDTTVLDNDSINKKETKNTSNSKETKKKEKRLTLEEEKYLHYLIRGYKRLDAYDKAFPLKRVNKLDTRLRTSLNLLAKPHIKKRYEQLLAAIKEEEVEKSQWSREQSIRTLRYVVEVNQNEVNRINEAAEEELELLLENIQKNPERAAEYAQKALLSRKQRRVSAIHNQGIVAAVSELNKMQGFNSETINMNSNVQFIGEDELED